jgi:DHA1 family inner membrane transport protein
LPSVPPNSSSRDHRGQAGNLITAYALAIVVGGPILTLWLARFEKRRLLIGLMALFIAGNLIGAVPQWPAPV